MIAITVSTNYVDLLPICLKQNHHFFKKWLIITDSTDFSTINLCKAYDNVHVLFWDFYNNGAKFDKGGAVRNAQEFAYINFPNEWYLLIDSDIHLSDSFSEIANSLHLLDHNFIYGSYFRFDYSKLSDFCEKKNKFFYTRKNIDGFFQLYKQHYLYESSYSARECDINFANLYPPNKKLMFTNFESSHLGGINGINHFGRKIGQDFLMDRAIESLTFYQPNDAIEEINISCSTISPDIKVARNDKCPCGSGNKFKACHGTLVA